MTRTDEGGPAGPPSRVRRVLAGAAVVAAGALLVWQAVAGRGGGGTEGLGTVELPTSLPGTNPAPDPERPRWQVALPQPATGLVAHQGRLIASVGGYLEAYDPETGARVWRVAVTADPRQATTAPVTAGSTLVVGTPGGGVSAVADGRVAWTRPPGAGRGLPELAAVAGVVVAAYDGVATAYGASDGSVRWRRTGVRDVSSGDPDLPTIGAVTPQGVVGLELEGGRTAWTVATDSGVPVSRPDQRHGWLAVRVGDDVLVIDVTSGELEFRVAGEGLRGAPLLTVDAVVVASAGGVLAADHGGQRWVRTSPRTTSVIAAEGDRVWLLERASVLRSVDARDGSLRRVLPLAGWFGAVGRAGFSPVVAVTSPTRGRLVAYGGG